MTLSNERDAANIGDFLARIVVIFSIILGFTISIIYDSGWYILISIIIGVIVSLIVFGIINWKYII